MRSPIAAALISVALVACAAPGATLDDDLADASQHLDAGLLDAGPVDAGSLDAGPADAGPACSGLTVGPGSFEWTVQQGSLTRTFRVHVPPSYDARVATPVVLDFHGFNSHAEEQDGYAAMAEISDESGFIAVHPQGVSARDLGQISATPDQRSWNAGKCCGVALTSAIDDVGFVLQALDVIEQQLCVDKRRVFAAGFSNGGYLTHRLGCEVADRIAAIASVAGPNNTAACSPARPMPVLHFHGTADFVVPFLGGPYSESAGKTVDDWATRNDCTGETFTAFQQGDSTCETRTGCTPSAATVTLCTIEGGGHTWPGGTVPAILGVTSHDLDATREAWKFFVAHPLP